MTCASLSLFRKAEVANERFINFASGSEIVLLQDFMIFAGMPSTPVAFFELDLVMNVFMISEVTGLKSKAVGAGMWAVIFWMLGWFNMSSGIGTDDMSWAAFTKNSFRVLATEIWFDMILSFSESIITGSFKSPLFDKNGFMVGQKSLDLGPPAHLSEK